MHLRKKASPANSLSQAAGPNLIFQQAKHSGTLHEHNDSTL